MSDTQLDISNAVIWLVNSGYLYDIGQQIGEALARAVKEQRQGAAAYVGKRGFSAGGGVPGVNPGAWYEAGIVVAVGPFGSTEEGLCTGVTLRLPSGEHVTRHIDYFRLLED